MDCAFEKMVGTLTLCPPYEAINSR
jgi:hypothetical protein